jgi:hypothetical protein
MRKSDEFMLATRQFDYACINSVKKSVLDENLIFMLDQEQAGLVFLSGCCAKSIIFAQKRL